MPSDTLDFEEPVALLLKEIDALRTMEAHAYRDLRDFIAGHARG